MSIVSFVLTLIYVIVGIVVLRWGIAQMLDQTDLSVHHPRDVMRNNFNVPRVLFRVFGFSRIVAWFLVALFWFPVACLFVLIAFLFDPRRRDMQGAFDRAISFFFPRFKK